MPPFHRPTRRVRLGAWTLAIALSLSLPAQAQLPTLGDGGDMTVGAERKIGARIARELYRDPDYIDDAVMVDYVQSLWLPLLAAARARGDLGPEIDERFAWQVLLGKDRSINAFALPGGWLGLHLGLVSTTSSRDELASVLAHELSHVTQRHISRLMTQQSRQAPLVIGAMILGALAASKSVNAANAIMMGGHGLVIQNQLSFSRDMEREADRIGYGVMTQAGFEPRGFVTMFEKLQQAARLNDNGNFPYLRSHPMSTERAADMQSRHQLGSATAAEPGLEHAVAAARARVLSHANVDAQRSFAIEAQSAGLAAQPAHRQAAVLYAAAFASLRQRDPAGATDFLRRLQPLVAGDARAARLARLLEAEVALAAGDGARALALADTGLRARPEVLLAAQAQLRLARAGEATQRLQTWVTDHPGDAAAWQLLAMAHSAAGQPLRAIRAEAEAQVAVLDYAAAMDRLRAAQDVVRRNASAGDHIEASIIDTRARAVESLLREQALER